MKKFNLFFILVIVLSFLSPVYVLAETPSVDTESDSLIGTEKENEVSEDNANTEEEVVEQLLPEEDEQLEPQPESEVEDTSEEQEIEADTEQVEESNSEEVIEEDSIPTSNVPEEEKQEGLEEEEKVDEVEEESVNKLEVEQDEEVVPEKDVKKTLKAKVQSVDDFKDGVLENGESHDALKTFKKQLNAVGFGGILETSNFGNYTVKKVKEFQKNYGLSVNGKLDKATIAKLDEVYNSPFQVNKSHSGVKGLKVKLNRMGFGGIIISENYGSYTAKKVKEFQQFANLKTNGIADTYTQAKLDHLFNHGYQTGDRFRKIANVKQKLNKIGFGGIKVTENYGSYTGKKVREFQSYYGLKATGLANGETIKKIENIYKNSYRQGMRDKDLKQIKRDLNSLGFSGITVTNYFGDYTKKQVKNFQKYYGLKATGVVEEKTLNKINDIKSNPFRVGVKHKETSKLKKNLNKLGFSGIKVTDYYGSYTEKQVKNFQKHYGLKASGIADKKTLAKIDEILSSPLQLGKRSNQLKEVKEKLNQIGYSGILVTNYFGSFTEKRVKQFQKDKRLPVSGIIDEITLKTIENSMVKIFIDPGHGGNDPGAIGYGLREKDIVLDIGLSARDYLTKNYLGVSVQLSRTTDRYLELEERAKLANQWGADYFISLHNNASGVSASGFETYIHNGKVSNATKAKQEAVHNYLVDRINNRDRGMKQADYSVLRNTNMSSILIEYMFIDNFVENGFLRKSSYRDWLGRITAEAIANAFQLKRK